MLEEKNNLLSLSATGGLLLLAWYDSFLLATAIAGLLAWAWYRHQAPNKPAPAPAQAPAPAPAKAPVLTNSTPAPAPELLIETLESSPAPAHQTDRVEEIQFKDHTKEEIVKSIESFDTEVLTPVKTKEPLTGVELVKQEMVLSSVRSQVEDFDMESLNKTEVEEKNCLPDQETIQLEKDKVDHLSGIESFPTEALTKVKTSEPLSGVEILKQELNQKAIGDEVTTYDKESLKHVDVEEKLVLPDSETLQAEKTRHNLMSGVEEFSKDSLTHVQTIEPLTGADLLKQEISMKSLNDSLTSFDSNSLKASVTEEKNVLPDVDALKSEKNHYEFLKELESGAVLSPTVAKEPMSGLEMLKQELTHKEMIDNLSVFDKEQLKSTPVEEKSWIPDVDTIQSEKSHLDHLKNISTFDQSALSPVKTSEPLTGGELAMQESMRNNITDELVSFDKSELKTTDTIEKISLPDEEIIKSEKQHQDFLTGVQTGVALKKTDTREPINPMDLLKLEAGKDQVEEEINAFDRSRLTPVTTEERQYLPSAEDIKTEALQKELDSLDQGHQDDSGVKALKSFLDEPEENSSSSPEEIEVPAASGAGVEGLRDILERTDRERSSSGEEWEKVSITTEEMTGQTSSEC